MLQLPDAWVWDFWVLDDGVDYHLFFLFASRALRDPEARHLRASVGHATSSDLVSWTRVADALVRGDPPAFDAVATWTGSTVRDRDGTGYLFYTGAERVTDGIAQTIGLATSPDLLAWTKVGPVLRLDPRWYAPLSVAGEGGDFRDPWVIPDPAGQGWHMLFTAKSAGGPFRDTGVVGHAVSADLRHWELRPPLTGPGQGFSQLEVPQTARIRGRDVLVFSCFGEDTAPERAATGVRAGVWAAPAGGPLGPFDLARAYPLTDETLYSGRLVQLRGTDRWCFLAFRNRLPDGGFGGSITNPVPVGWDEADRLVLGRDD